MNCNAAIAPAVLMAAFETLAMVPEQQCAGMQQGTAAVRSVGERPLDDRGDGNPIVLLLERPVIRPGVAGIFADAPLLAVGNGARSRRNTSVPGRKIVDGRAGSIHDRQDSNFPQAAERGVAAFCAGPDDYAAFVVDPDGYRNGAYCSKNG